ncbi:hypothetical protein [Microcoleus sp. FACHB-68]|uniref:hypothetical protein n=1 Tax=Microcoleus sp. FACHB-68 TaxID=2692826 RepID=UPI001685CFE6|nr:hypothetical protein [Microcoleus sp. FACHB-68]MBD1938190.1 hypothetical protein [Microcoleus sp. FACHB-68]
MLRAQATLPPLVMESACRPAFVRRAGLIQIFDTGTGYVRLNQLFARVSQPKGAQGLKQRQNEYWLSGWTGFVRSFSAG